MNLLDRVEHQQKRVENVRAWYAEHRESFMEALGFHTSQDEVIVAGLLQFQRYLNGNFPMFKDELGQERCDVLRAFIEGHQVDNEDLHVAVGMMMNALNAACDRIWTLEQAMQRYRPARPFPPLPPSQVEQPRRRVLPRTGGKHDWLK